MVYAREVNESGGQETMVTRLGGAGNIGRERVDADVWLE